MKDNKIQLGEYEILCNVDDNLHTHSRGWTVDRHCNAEFELHIVLGGHCDIDVEDRTYCLGHGFGMLIVPTVHHCSLDVSKDLVNIILRFGIKPRTAESAVIQKFYPCTCFPISDTTLTLCENMIRLTREKALYWREACKANQTLLFCEIMRTLAPEAKENSASSDNSHVRFDTIDQFFQEHYADKCDVSTLADMLHISERQLNRVLIKHYGMNFRQKLLRTRIDRAALLLRTTDIPISKISETVGYLSETSFFKAFKGQCGMTPKLYRKEFAKNGTYSQGND